MPSMPGRLKSRMNESRSTVRGKRENLFAATRFEHVEVPGVQTGAQRAAQELVVFEQDHNNHGTPRLWLIALAGV